MTSVLPRVLTGVLVLAILVLLHRRWDSYNRRSLDLVVEKPGKMFLQRELSTTRFRPQQVSLANWQWNEQMRAYQLLEEMRVAATDKDDSVFDPLWKLLDSYSMFQRSSHKGRVTRVAHLKTHKTASTTLSSIMFRFGARNKLRMFRPKGHERSGLPQGTMTKYLTPETAGKFRLEFHHISAFGRFKGSFQDVLTFYRHIIGEDVQIVTALREPTQQYVSWVYFFQAPNHPKKEPMDVLRDFAAAKRNANPLCGEFGLYTQNDLDVFLETNLDSFPLVLLFERLDESLVLMRRIFNWDLLDISYLKLLDSSSAAGSVRWDGKPIFPTPKVASLPEDLVRLIEGATDLDRQLYKAAVRKYEKLLAKHEYSFKLDEEVEAFQDMQKMLAGICKEHPLTELCKWYSEPDFYSLYGDVGFSLPVV